MTATIVNLNEVKKERGMTILKDNWSTLLIDRINNESMPESQREALVEMLELIGGL